MVQVRRARAGEGPLESARLAAVSATITPMRRRAPESEGELRRKRVARRMKAERRSRPSLRRSRRTLLRSPIARYLVSAMVAAVLLAGVLVGMSWATSGSRGVEDVILRTIQGVTLTPIDPDAHPNPAR